MVSSGLSISVEKQMYSRHNESLDEIYHFQSSVSDQCKSVTPLSFDTGLSNNLTGRQQICSNHNENNY
jgi:hypothetical protein